MKVLLVDDSLVDRVVAESLLQELGHQVILGTNGREAVDLYFSEDPDLLLLDENMPELMGHEAVAMIRERDQDWAPIIFMSSNYSPEAVAAGIDAGGDDYLAKPIDRTILYAKIKAMERIATMRLKMMLTRNELEKANIELKRQVARDGLTGLSNRRSLDVFLKHESARCHRSREPLSVAMMDIDHFKKFNDTYGHLAGDECLIRVARLLEMGAKRTTDMVARYGGEEFCLVLPVTGINEAKELCERLRHSIEVAEIPNVGTERGVVTLSIGVYSSVPTDRSDPQTFLEHADEALYQAKNQGRNCVHVWSELMSGKRLLK